MKGRLDVDGALQGRTKGGGWGWTMKEDKADDWGGDWGGAGRGKVDDGGEVGAK